MFRFLCPTILLTCFVGVTFGDDPSPKYAKPDPNLITENLWPSNNQNSNNQNSNNRNSNNRNSNLPGLEVDHPTDFDIPKLRITKVESDRATAAVVILPGGGYWGVSMDNEGYDIANFFKSMGITSAICTYRVRGTSTHAFDQSIPKDKKAAPGNDGKGYGHPYPRMDAQRAIQTLRARAKEFNIDPGRIGVIGFSAGGHLAATVSNQFADRFPNHPTSQPDAISKTSSRPDFSILCYPVIGLGKSYTHGGSQKNLLGEDADDELIASMSMEHQVSEQTPPTFLFHTAEDKAVLVENSIQYFRACQAKGVQTELHVFPNGHHGLGLSKHVAGPNQWPILCESWLNRIGMID